jgi:hypothetical protein
VAGRDPQKNRKITMSKAPTVSLRESNEKASFDVTITHEELTLILKVNVYVSDEISDEISEDDLLALHTVLLSSLKQERQARLGTQDSQNG